ncbi:brassinosteroid-responsive RING protein 1-like [Vigna umbellata]|uniref:brassinosteroid-responsive RING protein 1-like n=1 Tax=Vigna umbellata TaxID=87088 RepID=UPI001F5E87EC|nr:brassinosteroid-responsive RING protein 1-like [Vigna umbellata]
MGFPVGYTEWVLPKVLLHLLSVLGLIRKLLTILLCYMGFHDFFEPDIAWPERLPELQSVSAVLIREILPVVKFSEMAGAEGEAAESCAVCLYEFEGDDEIRRLTNCRHIFHRGCLDRWMGYDQRTCPLCRTPFIPHHMQAAFNDRLWAASGIPQFYYNDE